MATGAVGEPLVEEGGMSALLTEPLPSQSAGQEPPPKSYTDAAPGAVNSAIWTGAVGPLMSKR